MKMMGDVLVTGGTGVIGAWVVRELAENGYGVHVFTRGTTSVGIPLLEPVADRIHRQEGDIEDPWTLADAMKRIEPELIVHFATVKPWQIDARFVTPKPLLGVRNMIVGTANVLEAARMYGGRRVVMASTKGVYAPFEGAHGFPEFVPVPESYPCDPDTMYGLGKLTAERLGAYYHNTFGLDVVSFRFSTTYGPFKRASSGHPAGIIQRTLEGQEVEVVATPAEFDQARDDLIYNRDIARAVRLACEKTDRLPHLVYNIGTGQGRTLRELVDVLSRVAPRNKLRVVVDETAESTVSSVSPCVFDVGLARQDFGFETTYDLESGVAETAEIVRQAPA